MEGINKQKEISLIINKHDPVHLFGHGVPEDEYMGEAFEVCKFLEENQLLNLNSEQIAEALRLIFTSRFTEDIVNRNLPAYSALADDIYEFQKDQKTS